MNCPLNSQCLTNIIPRANIRSGKEQKIYISSTKTDWKHRFYNHKLTINTI